MFPRQLHLAAALNSHFDCDLSLLAPMNSFDLLVLSLMCLCYDKCFWTAIKDRGRRGPGQPLEKTLRYHLKFISSVFFYYYFFRKALKRIAMCMKPQPRISDVDEVWLDRNILSWVLSKIATWMDILAEDREAALLAEMTPLAARYQSAGNWVRPPLGPPLPPPSSSRSWSRCAGCGIMLEPSMVLCETCAVARLRFFFLAVFLERC